MGPLILVADDAAFMRRVIRRTLAEGGYDEIEEARDGKEALEKYREKRPQLVLLDLTMPDKPGLQVMDELLENDAHANIVICSAVGQQVVMQKAMAAGAKGFVAKPFTSHDLLDAVKKGLGN